jgi:hypothetical protein
MRIKMFVTLVTAFLLLQVDGGRAQSDRLMGGIVLAPNSSRHLTLSRNGALLASFTVPKGMFLFASYDDQQPTSIADGRWEFHGNFELRASSASEALQPGVRSDALPTNARSGFGPRIQQMMSQAPLVLTVQGVDAVIENVEQ